MKIDTNSKKIEEILDRSVEKIYPSKDILKKALISGKRMKVYFGIDPTAPFLHLDHGTSLLILKRFQNLGHKTVLLFGDFTARIGDPTGKLSSRKQLSKKEVIKNYKDYESQIKKVLDIDNKKNPVEIVFNSNWLEKMDSRDLIDLMSQITLGRIITRDMFQQRMKKGKEIYLNEFIYPILQGYDSVALDVDIEIGGTDQIFNMLVGRDLMKIYKKKEKFVIAKKMLEDPKTGKFLMSKSEGRYIALNDSPKEMYGKIMAIPDEVIPLSFEHWTEIPLKDISEIKKEIELHKVNPKNIKARLAKEIVEMYHSKKDAEKAEKEFNRIFQQKKIPEQMQEIKIQEKAMNILDLLVKLKLAVSKAEAKRLIMQNGIKIDEKTHKDWRISIKIKKGMIFQKGKRQFVKII